MSPLMFSNPARRAAAKAARACFAVWGRPSVLSWLSRADWTPKEYLVYGLHQYAV